MNNYSRAIQTIQTKNAQETKAVQHHIQVFSSLKGILADYDGKVFNRRLETLINKQTGHRVLLDTEYDRQNLTVFARSTGASYRNQVSLEVVTIDNRVNAEKTLQNLETLLAQLDTDLTAFTYNEERTFSYIKQMEEVERLYLAARDSAPNITKEELRRYFPYVR